MEFSVIIPSYRCSNSLRELNERLVQTLSGLSTEFEIIYVNDASPENDWEIIQHLSNNDKRIKGIYFSRNFGQHYAITAGLEHCSGEWVVVMDGDLQDQPEEIKKLYKKAKEGFEIVFAQRKVRKDHFLKKVSSKLFYAVFSYLTETKQDHTIANFGIYHKKVIDAICSMNDQIRYFPTMAQWVGFKKTSIIVQHSARNEGKSAYSFKKLLRLAFNNIIAFSDKPLRLVVKFGFFITLVSLLLALFYLYRYFSGDIEVMGFTSLILSVWFLSGIIISILGVVGIYIGKTFEKVKDRPKYIIGSKINF